MQRNRMYSVPGLVFLQILISFCIVGCIVTIMNYHYGPFISVISGSLIGLLLTTNISRGLFALQVMLDRLVSDLPVEFVSLRRHWPLTPLFRLAKELSYQRGRQILVEQQTDTYKDQFMQQVIKTTAQEERNRLARDLHDSIKQQIFSITMSAAAAKVRWEQNLASVRKIIDDIERTAREAQVEMQAMLQQLRPDALENIGLLESLRMQCQALEYRTGARVSVEFGQLPSEELLPPGSHEMIFRIVQEGFANIAHHARATHIWLSLYQQQQELLLEIGDDGQGFDRSKQPDHSSQGGMGLKNVSTRIQELHGIAKVWSMVGQGTTLHISIPLLAQQKVLTGPETLETEIVTSVRKTRCVLNIGLCMIDLAAATIVLDTPLPIAQYLIFMCLFAAIITWIVAQYLRVHIAISLGLTHVQTLSIAARNYKLLVGIFTLGIFYVGYIRYTWLFSPEFFINPGILVWIALTLFLVMLYYQTMEQYRKKLSHHEIQEQIRQRQQHVVFDFLALSIVVGFLSFFGVITPDIHIFRLSLDHWTQNADLLLCTLWLVINICKFIYTTRWQQLVNRKVTAHD